MNQNTDIGLRMTVKAAKRLFLDRAAVVSRLDKVARRRLATFGGYCMRVARNSIKPKRDMTLDELPDDLKALIGQSRLQVKGRKARKVSEQQLKQEIWPWPKTTSAPGQPPKFNVSYASSGRRFNQFKDLILFVVESNLQSVVIGPIIFNRQDTPGLLEDGGQAVRYQPEWYRRKDGTIGVNYERQSQTFAPHPYMAPAFDKTLDAQVPRIFREIL